MALEPELVAIAIGVFLLAGIIKGLIGIGLPTAAVGMLSQVIDPRVAIALMVFPSLLSNAWQVWRMGDLGGAEVIGPILLGMKKPVHILQLGSTVRQIVNMAAIAVIDAQAREREEE